MVELLFGSDGLDFAMLHKLYGNEGGVEGQRRYSAAVCTGIDKRHFMHYNFCRLHHSLTITRPDGNRIKQTPAMAACVATHA